MSTKTIDPQHAADLYELIDGHGSVDPAVILDENTGAHGWTVVGSAPIRQSRWHDQYWMVLRDEAGATWGLDYGIGLTEDQENDLPWEDGDAPIALVRLYPHEVTRTEYRTQPATEATR